MLLDGAKMVCGLQIVCARILLVTFYVMDGLAASQGLGFPFYEKVSTTC